MKLRIEIFHGIKLKQEKSLKAFICLKKEISQGLYLLSHPLLWFAAMILLSSGDKCFFLPSRLPFPRVGEGILGLGLEDSGDSDLG